jgi:hypothetical protein
MIKLFLYLAFGLVLSAAGLGAQKDWQAIVLIALFFSVDMFSQYREREKTKKLETRVSNLESALHYVEYVPDTPFGLACAKRMAKEELGIK